MQEKTTASPFDYSAAWQWLDDKGKQLYGQKFRLYEEDRKIIDALLCYFLKDHLTAPLLGINPQKGIMLSGPVGCGKTSLMTLMKYLTTPSQRHIVKPCRDVTFEFIKQGYDIIHRYSRSSNGRFDPQVFCFDDLGTEKSLKYYGNDCNVMAEILLTRYDLFVQRQLATHLTTNLSASEIEAVYGSRLRSRMREMFNLISFDASSKDKRK